MGAPDRAGFRLYLGRFAPKDQRQRHLFKFHGKDDATGGGGKAAPSVISSGAMLQA